MGPGAGPAMDVDHPGDRQRAQPGAAVAGVEDGLVGRARDAILTGVAVPHQHGVGAGHAKVVQGLNRRGPALPDRRMDGGRDQREKVVGMHYVGTESVHRGQHRGDASRCMSGLDSGSQSIGPGPDGVVAQKERLDDLPGGRQGGSLPLHDGILPAADLIAVVNDQHPQGFDRTHRRGSLRRQGHDREWLLRNQRRVMSEGHA